MKNSNRGSCRFVLPGAIAALLICGLICSCSSTHPRRDPTGETFPSIRGDSLDGKTHSIPEDLAGEPALLLVGFKMESQFDLDRWLLGLSQAGAGVKAYELPTIPGLLPGLFAGKIDEGMRSGIPQEDWGGVITIYGDADTVTRFVGNENPLPGRIILLDARGRVVFFHDRGFSVGTLQRLLEEVKRLKKK